MLLSEWALSDQLVFSTVSSLLRLAMSHVEHRGAIMDCIYKFVSITVSQLKESDRV